MFTSVGYFLAAPTVAAIVRHHCRIRMTTIIVTTFVAHGLDHAHI